MQAPIAITLILTFIPLIDLSAYAFFKTSVLMNLCYGRDKTMADAILMEIKDNETLLVITGKRHLDGIAKHLKDAGFKSV